MTLLGTIEDLLTRYHDHVRDGLEIKVVYRVTVHPDGRVVLLDGTPFGSDERCTVKATLRADGYRVGASYCGELFHQFTIRRSGTTKTETLTAHYGAQE